MGDFLALPPVEQASTGDLRAVRAVIAFVSTTNALGLPAPLLRFSRHFGVRSTGRLAVPDQHHMKRKCAAPRLEITSCVAQHREGDLATPLIAGTEVGLDCVRLGTLGFLVTARELDSRRMHRTGIEPDGDPATFLAILDLDAAPAFPATNDVIGYLTADFVTGLFRIRGRGAPAP